MKNTLIAVLLMTVAPAFASSPLSNSKDSTGEAKYRVTRDQNYIYVKRPKALVFDSAEQESMQKIDQVIQSQLGKIDTKGVSDPDGDLKALDDSMKAFQGQIDELVKVSGQVYNEVKHTGWFKADPTGILLFGGVEYDANLVKFVTGGGSMMVGIVAMPMEVRKYRLDTRQYVDTETQWDTSWVAIPTVNVGPGVTSSGGGKSLRAGVGLVWGTLNSASELVGFTVGPSVTAQLMAGINVKMLALKNMAKAGAISNTILMIGLERPNATPSNNISVFGYSAEAHVNLSGMVDLASILSPISRYVGMAGAPARD